MEADIFQSLNSVVFQLYTVLEVITHTATAPLTYVTIKAAKLKWMAQFMMESN